MPNIRTYETPEAGLKPTEVGVEAWASAGRRGAALFNQTGDAVASTGQKIGGALKAAGDVAENYIEHREINQGSAAYAGLNDKLTQAWNDTVKNSDPNDPTIAAKFREEVLNPQLEQYRSAFMTEGGQKFAESRIQQLRNHMFEKTTADMSSLAADAVAVNMRTTANSLSNTAFNDPSAVPHLLESTDALVGGMIDSSPNLKGAAASKARMELTQKMKEEIVKSGAISAIAKSGTPEATAEDFGKRYPEYISGPELKTLSANARQQTRAQRIDEAYLDRTKDKEAQDKSDVQETRYLQAIHSDDPKQQAQISAKAIVNDEQLSRNAKERLISVVNREMKPETAAQMSNGNAMDLLQRIRAPDGSPDRINNLDEIYKARIDGKLNKTDFDMLRKEFTDVRTPEGERLSARKTEFLKAVQPSIDGSNPLMGKIDKDGKLNSYRLMVDLDNKIAEYRAAGKNPYDLMDPSKPDYMGNAAALQPYQKPLQDSIRDQARKLTGGGSRNLTGPNTTITGIEVTDAPVAVPKITARKPGESPADYLKRTGS